MYYLLSLKYSNGNLFWWKPHRRGYTDDLNKAGLYPPGDVEVTTDDGKRVIKKSFYNSDTVAISAEDAQALYAKKCIDYSGDNLKQLGIERDALPDF